MQLIYLKVFLLVEPAALGSAAFNKRLRINRADQYSVLLKFNENIMHFIV